MTNQTTAKQNSKFQKNTAVYICAECGKKTRDTGKGEAEVEMCATCYTEAQKQNAISDGRTENN